MAFGNKHKQAAANSGMTIIAEGSRLAGDLELQSALHIDGALRGTVISSNSVSIGTSGHFTGTITARHVLICGTVEGDLDCERVEIAPTGKLTGDLVCQELVIEPGARFFGSSRPRGRAVDDAAEHFLGMRAGPEPVSPAPAAAEARPAAAASVRTEPALTEAAAIKPTLSRAASANATPTADAASNDPVLEETAPAEPAGRGRWRVAPRPAASADYR